MKRARRLLGLPAVALVLAASTSAWAYWSAGGAGVASVTTASLSAATVGVPASATNTVTVTWSAQASLVPSSAANSQIAYTVPAQARRRLVCEPRQRWLLGRQAVRHRELH